MGATHIKQSGWTDGSDICQPEVKPSDRPAGDRPDSESLLRLTSTGALN